MKSINYLRQFGADIDGSLELFGDEATYNETLTEFNIAMEEINGWNYKRHKETDSVHP